MVIKDLSDSYSKTASIKKPTRIRRGFFVSFSSDDIEEYADYSIKQSLVQTGTKEERALTRAELYLNPMDDGSLTKVCYKCGKLFTAKPWFSSSLWLCKNCDIEEETRVLEESVVESKVKWRFKEQDRTQSIRDLINRNY